MEGAFVSGRRGGGGRVVRGSRGAGAGEGDGEREGKRKEIRDGLRKNGLRSKAEAVRDGGDFL